MNLNPDLPIPPFLQVHLERAMALERPLRRRRINPVPIVVPGNEPVTPSRTEAPRKTPVTPNTYTCLCAWGDAKVTRASPQLLRA